MDPAQPALPADYTRPTDDWVSEVLFGCNAISPPNRVLTHIDWSKDSLLAEMMNGIGGDSNPSGLTLADKGVNGRKGKLFGGSTIPGTNLKTNKDTRISHRNVRSFSYCL